MGGDGRGERGSPVGNGGADSTSNITERVTPENRGRRIVALERRSRVRAPSVTLSKLSICRKNDGGQDKRRSQGPFGTPIHAYPSSTSTVRTGFTCSSHAFSPCSSSTETASSSVMVSLGTIPEDRWRSCARTKTSKAILASLTASASAGVCRWSSRLSSIDAHRPCGPGTPTGTLARSERMWELRPWRRPRPVGPSCPGPPRRSPSRLRLGT
jgi:hypothetical protein